VHLQHSTKIFHRTTVVFQNLIAMAFLRRGGWTIVHAGIIGGGLFYSAREIFSHDHSDSTDVYRRPVESPFSQSLNTPIAPLIEPFEELSPVSPINEALPLTTPEYITITITPTPEDEDHDPSPVPPVRGNLNGHDPYADNPFIQAWARKIAPIFGNSYFQALVRIIEFFWNHRFTQVIVRAINALISFGFYLWLLLPGGLRDLVEMICDWAWISAFIVWLLKWLFRKFPGRGNNTPPSDGSAPPPPPPSGGPPGGDNNNPPPGGPKPADAPAGPKPPTNTTLNSTQTRSTQTSASTQTSRPTEADKSTQTPRITAANDRDIAHQAQTITDLRQNLADLRQTNANLQQHSADQTQQINGLVRHQESQSSTIRYNRDQINKLKSQQVKDNEDVTNKINKLETECDAAVMDLESATKNHKEEIERQKKAHEAQIKKANSTCDDTIQRLESELASLHLDISKLEHTNGGLQNENNALDEEIKSTPSKAESPSHAEERHKREMEDAIAREAHALKEADRLKKKVTRCESRIADLEKEKKEESAREKRAAGPFAPPPEGESAEVKSLDWRIKPCRHA
jgi:hypothetical protein